MTLTQFVRRKIDSFTDRHVTPYKAVIPAVFFLVGFVYDIVTLDRIDSVFGVCQQLLFILLAVSLALVGQVRIAGVRQWQPTHRALVRSKDIFWNFHNEMVHFFIGSLLSAFTLFYVKSASSWSSFICVFVLFTILLLNEKMSNQSVETSAMIKWVLLSLCLYTFYSYTIPMLLGFVGWTTTALTSSAFLVSVAGLYWVQRRIGIEFAQVKEYFLLPSLGTFVGISLFIVLNWVPPIPISAHKIGIYHNVQREGEHYILSHQKPWWRFWHSSDQKFLAADGDKLYGYARVFSPVGFSDNIYFHWMLDTKDGWKTVDRIAVNIRGGREEGYRAVTFKSNYEPGDWMLFVETENGSEIGRVAFSVERILPINMSNRPFVREND